MSSPCRRVVVGSVSARAGVLFPALLLSLVFASRVVAHPPPDRPGVIVDPEAEALIHTPAGFAVAGEPRDAVRGPSGRVKVTMLDAADGRPTFCRVNVVGADGHFYEPRDTVLSPYSLHRLGNRPGKGPFRYYGWFFYSAGEFEVEVPPGATRVEVWKGYEFRPERKTIDVSVDKTAELQIALHRTAPLEELGYYSGDTHIHLDRKSADDDARALDLMAAEDMQYGVMLAHNDGKTYSGVMDRLIHPQQRGFGPSAIAARGKYSIASGQEYVTSAYGHIYVFLHQRLLLDGLTVDPNRWPTLGSLGEEGRRLGGYSFHAHGGYGKEIYVDFARRALDGVELLQFAEYRGIALDGWYRMLNIGYRFPGVGACDYPACRVLGDCRTYVYAPERPTFDDWGRRAIEGRSFFTTGPLLLLEVDGARPGDVLRRTATDVQPVRAKVRLRSEVAPVTHVELLVNGRSRGPRAIPKELQQGEWFEFEETLPIAGASWIAARAWSNSPPGRPDAEAHTNPVWVTLDDRLPYHEADLDWLVKQIDERIAEVEKRTFDERPQVLDYYRRSRATLLELRQAGGQRVEKK